MANTKTTDIANATKAIAKANSDGSQVATEAIRKLDGYTKLFISKMTKTAVTKIPVDTKTITTGVMRAALEEIFGAEHVDYDKMGTEKLNTETAVETQRKYRSKIHGLTIQVPRVERIVRSEMPKENNLTQDAVIYLTAVVEKLIANFTTKACDVRKTQVPKQDRIKDNTYQLVYEGTYNKYF